MELYKTCWCMWLLSLGTTLFAIYACIYFLCLCESRFVAGHRWFHFCKWKIIFLSFKKKMKTDQHVASYLQEQRANYQLRITKKITFWNHQRYVKLHENDKSVDWVWHFEIRKKIRFCNLLYNHNKKIFTLWFYLLVGYSLTKSKIVFKLFETHK
jgi:hypothetical protein